MDPIRGGHPLEEREKAPVRVLFLKQEEFFLHSPKTGALIRCAICWNGENCSRDERMSENMERVKVIAFQKELIDAVFDIQRKAYKLLFDKYHDTNTSPYLESKEEILQKYTRPGTYGYIFLDQGIPVGAVRIIARDDVCKVSALAVLPEYQNRGIAQAALKEIESIHSGCKCWVLDTILEEKGNCHLYEKLGYTKSGEPQAVDDHMTLIHYKKQIVAAAL